MHTGPRVTWEQSESSSRLETDESARAATAYLAWPVALVELSRPHGTSLWYRAHLRQAATLGIACSVALVALFALPLAVVLSLGGPGTGETIAIYAIAMLVDVVALVLAIVLIVRCAIRASRGELFSLPWVSAIGERVFARRRDAQ